MNISVPAPKQNQRDRARGVSVLLGPTNTGKTHFAIERMLSHPSGMIGLPLRLLAREVYQRAVEKAGSAAVALITGEEKIKPKTARYFISTVEAMPRDLEVSFVAVDEIQLAADLDRGHVFTDRLLRRRGQDETLLIGAATMQRAVEELLPGVKIASRPRLSALSFAGEKKMTRLPRRSAIVAFSAEEVYAIAEWIRRQRGGAAVVLGALSPRTRNAQVEMFQNGDVDYIVATDAIGMGLNLDVDHIAFAADRKFDGWQHRRLNPAELAQIAGRAGRHTRDGTFGTTGRCAPFDAEIVEALEEHRFDFVRTLQWRNTDLDFSSIRDLAASLDVLPGERRLTRAPLAEDQMVLDIAARNEKAAREACTRQDIARLWECCQIPDYRKLSPAAHADLVLSIFGFVVRAGYIPDDWFVRHISALDRVDGDLGALSARIAEVRTWTFVANRSDWLRDPEHWQSVARQVEDRLSDALHERLAQRFVDRRTSVLMRRLRENAMLEAEVTASGDVLVEGQHVGQLNGFRFTGDPQAVGEAAKALNAAAQKALAGEIEGRATRVHEAVDEAFVLANDGIIRWLGEPVAKIAPGGHVLEPRACILADDHLTGPALEMAQRRLDLWLAQHVKKLLGPLAELEAGAGLEGIARGIAFQVAESLGVLERSKVADDLKNLPQEARAALRKFGIRFGAYHLYLPNLLKPAPRALAAQLWALKNGGVEEVKGLDDVPHLAASGRTSFIADKEVQRGLYRAAGFRVCGDRAVRVDILERLADLIRPAIAYRPGVTAGDPPVGAADDDGFVITVAMTSLAGCSGESFATILRSLGYVLDRRKGPAITAPLRPLAAMEPAAPGVVDLASPEDAEGEPNPEAAAVESDGPPKTAILETDPTETRQTEELASEDPSAAAADSAQLVEEVRGPVSEEESPQDLTGRESANEPACVEHRDFEDSRVAAAAPPAASETVVPDMVRDFDAAPAEDTPAEDTPAEDTPAEDTPAEPPMIDVWRPHRQHHHARRPEGRANRRPEKREAGAVAVPDAEQAEGGARNRRPTAAGRPSGQDHRRGGQNRAGKGEALPASAETLQTGGEDRAQDRGQSQNGARPAGRVQTQHRPQGQGRGRFEGHDRREGGGGQQRFGTDERRHGRNLQAGGGEKRSNERPPDPDSPFAKLLVLKARLEEKTTKES
ncbi:helicase-related protein [Methylocapsa palsarum]|uniref:ATP-dependent RNA helicase SUPV3L1/SUV3 n=1 Tax=Methylocapsa palsarum TaxID=1612308 RepID=A0A1I3VS51_9HYPH|nr:helicase-related protein [Methylocapsa palsarum]SFJ98000.1 ATP-dependent RNA helicase SUPV3L1/SUV3 [Methylocapsa palsarum]